MNNKFSIDSFRCQPWKIPCTKEPGGLQSMGSLRVRHDRATSPSLFPFMHWRRKWQPTPVFLPGESQGWRSLVGCNLWGFTESDKTKVTQQQHQHVSLIHLASKFFQNCFSNADVRTSVVIFSPQECLPKQKKKKQPGQTT